MGYYWPDIFKDANKYAQDFDSCQRMGRPGQSDEMPLQPQLVIEPFENGHWILLAHFIHHQTKIPTYRLP